MTTKLTSLFFSIKLVSNRIFFPTYFTYKSHCETVQFASFEDWIPFGNYMSAFYRKLLYKGGDGELELMPGQNSIKDATFSPRYSRPNLVFRVLLTIQERFLKLAWKLQCV